MKLFRSLALIAVAFCAQVGLAAASISHIGTDNSAVIAGATTSFSVTADQTPSTGDVLVLYAVMPAASGSTTITPPAGFAQALGFSTTYRAFAYYCVVNGSQCNTASLGSFSLSSSQKVTWWLSEWSGVNTLSVVNASSGTSCTSGVTTCTENCAAAAGTSLLCLSSVSSGSSTDSVSSVTSGWTNAVTKSGTIPQLWGYYDNGVSGTTNFAATFSASTTASSYISYVVLNPASATAPPSNRMMMGCCK
jgi:hypothetical protein